jgi:uncharacterized protein (TIRG00374 family)
VNDRPYLSGWRYRAVIISIVCSALGYLGFSLWGGWQDVGHAVTKVGVSGIALALLMSLTNYGLRFLRWQIYLKSLGHPIPWLPSLRIYLAGFALTTTPGKAGESLRGILLKPWHVPFPKSFAAFVSERLSDLLAAVILAFLGLSLYPTAWPIILVSVMLIAIVLPLISQQHLLTYSIKLIGERSGKLFKPIKHILQILLESHYCNTPFLLISSTFISIIAWTAEAFAFYLIVKWMGTEIPISLAIFIYVISMLGGAISFMPGGLGSAEAIMISILIAGSGMPHADAIAATLLIRLTTLWFAVGIGAASLSSVKS